MFEHSMGRSTRSLRRSSRLRVIIPGAVVAATTFAAPQIAGAASIPVPARDLLYRVVYPLLPTAVPSATLPPPVAGPLSGVLPAPRYCDFTPATIRGTEGDDEIIGTAGNDVISAGGGDDSVYGGGGDDIICGGNGHDFLDGKGGDDLLQAGNDDGTDTSWGVLTGGGGDDELYGGPFDDSLFGNAGDDYLEGRNGSNYCDGGTGDNVLRDCSNHD